MKKRLVQTITQDGHVFGQVSNPLDLMKAEDFLHDRLSQLAHDFLNNQRANETVGFSYSLGAGNAFNITIAAPGRIYTADGTSFDLQANTTLNVPAADDDYPRQDLIVAVLEDEIDAQLQLIPFVRLRTSDEFTNGAAAYPPQNISAATEKHWRAVVQIRTGTTGSDTPVVPTVAANEVPLYSISVAAGATRLRDEDIRDLRQSPTTLRGVSDLAAKTKIDLATLRELVEKNADIGSLIVAGHLLGGTRTLRDILYSLQQQISVAREMPDVRYDNPKVSLTNPNSSKIMATGGVDGVPVVNVEIGGRINFGDTDVILTPDRFPSELNARFEKTGGASANTSREEALTLLSVTQVAADGALG